jgi:hypothetical protein
MTFVLMLAFFYSQARQTIDLPNLEVKFLFLYYFYDKFLYFKQLTNIGSPMKRPENPTVRSPVGDPTHTFQ